MTERNTVQVEAPTGNYPGMIRDISACSSLDEVIEMVPAIGESVSMVPVYIMGDENPQMGDYCPSRVEQSQAVRNDTTGSVYSIVSNAYGIMQHRDALAICETFKEKGAQYDSAGVMASGGTTWVSLSVPSVELRQADGSLDELRPKLLVLSDHTTAYADKVISHMTRLFCNNQLPMIAGAKGTVSIRHRANVQQRFEACRELFGGMDSSIGDTLDAFRRLASLPMGTQAFTHWAERTLSAHRGDAQYLDHEGELRTHARRQRDIDDLTEYFEGGNQGAGATAWGAFQSLTGWLDHKAERLEEAKRTRARMERNWSSNTIGDGAKLKERALSHLTKS